MLNFQTFSAWIVIDGLSSDEFNVEHRDVDGTMHVSCWVPSEAGKKFQVHFKDMSGMTSNAYVYIDGNKSGGRVMRPERPARYLDGLRISSTASRPFVFSNLNFTDEEDNLSALGSLNVGQIEVTAGFVHVGGHKQATQFYEVPPEQKFNEKAKKGVDHQTQFGDIVHHRHTVRSVTVIPRGKEVVRFCFRYRPLAIEVLRAHGIAPPVAASSSSKSKKRPISPSDKDVKPQPPEVIELSDSEDEKQASFHAF
ncbi:hypothetical protein D9757_010374 [Collybiopsis confluens]|uniref:DUF7918 domain-containing protein n=1 Tax=Collybiopsis confluens TaxID=2823264 RepID=A0A8H5GUM7_9AGAR|nr:hypothetical protein D9757_012377 [Collybiopsis confluens]KAF5371539.1 hypothetical protein D9757_010374 [Collybiopsis confluens]